MQELFWNCLWMVFSLHDIVVNAVPHVVSALYHAEYLIIKEYCVFVCGTEDNMMGESRQSVLIQDIAKSGVDKGQTVVYYTYLLSQKIYGGITNSIPNVKEPLSKERISCPHVGGEAKGVGIVAIQGSFEGKRQSDGHWYHAARWAVFGASLHPRLLSCLQRA